MEKPEIQVLSENFRSKARTNQHLSKWLIYLGITLSVISLFFEKISVSWNIDTHDWEWVFVFLSLISQVIAQYVHNGARKFHLNSRDGYRWFLISSSFEDDQTKINTPLNDLKQRALEMDFEKNVSKTAGEYYFSKSKAGLKRFVENLHESIFFTKAIMETANNKRTKSVCIIVGIIVTALIAVLTLGSKGNNIDPYLTSLAMFSLVVALIIDLIYLNRTKYAIMELGVMEELVRSFIIKTNDQLAKDISIIFDFAAKYYSLTSEQEVLNNQIYKKHNQNLSKNYSDLINQINSLKK